MNKNVYKVYYTDPADNKSYGWDSLTLSSALSDAELFRKRGFRFVTMVSESIDQVGKQGVAGVSDGKLPNGDTYDYTKRDALSQRSKNTTILSTDSVEVPLDDE